jgi:aminoglycoside 3-N-acetyltransferase
MPPLLRSQIVEGLRALGVQRGSILLVHSSLSSLGQVDGGAETVIEALLEALGPDGTLLMPTHPARDGRTFDVDTIPSDMGIISETFRKRPGVLRSRHPFHPVAAFGAQALEMLRDHEQSPVPDGPDTPYGRLISEGGWVLHIGCDLDTLTLVHTVEAELDLPFLSELDMKFTDSDGNVQTLHLTRCPGGHRGGVLKFDRRFRDEGAMAVGRIGQAVCRLISAPRAAAIMRREMGNDPFFTLDHNPHCADCRRYRGRIRSSQLAREDFTLTAPLWAVAEDTEASLDLIQEQGISMIELDARCVPTSAAGLEDLRFRLQSRSVSVAVVRAPVQPIEKAPELVAIAERLGAQALHVSARSADYASSGGLEEHLRALGGLAADHQIDLLVANRLGSPAETGEQLAALVDRVGLPSVSASYDPSEVARGGVSPFYMGLYRGKLRRYVRHIDLRDLVSSSGRAVPLGCGNAEIVEIISSQRCRSYDGFFCLWPMTGDGPDGFRRAAESFWRIMDSI